MFFLNEKVLVCAIFDQGRIKPIWFMYKNKKFIIKHVYYKWKEHQGEDIIYKFTVTDDSSVYELGLSMKNMIWYLLAIDEEKY